MGSSRRGGGRGVVVLGGDDPTSPHAVYAIGGSILSDASNWTGALASVEKLYLK